MAAGVMLERGTYKGLVMHCAPGTHEAALALLLRHDPPRSPVLDLASGSGAWLLRLSDAGFGALHAVEPGAEGFGLPGITPLAIDLNSEFGSHFGQRFPVVTAIEIIEHLDSPRHFLAQVRGLLPDGGYLLLTTPNVANWIGRIKFLLRGELRWFDENLYHRMRHISPLTDVQLRLMLSEMGFHVVDSVTAGSFLGPFVRLVTAPVRLAFRALFGPRVLGDTSVYLARKSPTVPARRAPGVPGVPGPRRVY